MTCTSCQVVNFTPFEEVKRPVSNSAVFSFFKYPFEDLRILEDLGVFRVLINVSLVFTHVIKENRVWLDTIGNSVLQHR